MEELYKEYPLPWVVDDNREGREGLVTVFAANGQPVVCTGDMEGCSWADILNARLFAAAPDLLAACEAELEVYDGMDVTKLRPQTLNRILTLRLAVAKAHGKS